MVIGTPKTLSEVPTFCQFEIDELVNGIAGVFKQGGMPPDMVSAIEFKHLSRMAATVDRYRAVVVELDQVQQHIVDKNIEPELALVMIAGVAKKATELINVEQPKESRLVLPGGA